MAPVEIKVAEIFKTLNLINNEEINAHKNYRDLN